MFASADLKKTIEMAVDIGYERIILAGDKDQLPPIGWGAPFADLIKSAACPVTTLNTIHRTDAGGGIAQICRDLREGKPLRRDYSNVKICDATNDELAAQVSDIYARFVSLVKSPGDIMVLSPYSGANQDFGAPALSLAIRTALELPDRMTVGDIVIGTENERRRRYILNGSRGVVLREGSEREGVDYRGLCPRGKDFLGYRPSVGELIAAFLLAIIAERTGRWFSRLWDFLLDKGAALSYRLRDKRIAALEGQIKILREYTDRKVILLLLHRIISGIVLISFLVMCSMLWSISVLHADTFRIINYFDIPPLVKPILHLGTLRFTPVREQMMGLLVTICIDIISLTIMILYFSAWNTIDRLIDPSQTISRLEQRILSLKAKGRV